MKPTQRPWKVFYAKNNGDLILGIGEACNSQGITDSTGHMWGDDAEAKANAEHIVKCVNSHDELLEAAKWARAYFQFLKQADENIKKGRCIYILNPEMIETELEKAIQKAEGK